MVYKDRLGFRSMNFLPADGTIYFQEGHDRHAFTSPEQAMKLAEELVEWAEAKALATARQAAAAARRAT